MDSEIFKIGGISSGLTFGVFIFYKIITWINNKRIHSSCNGHNLDIELSTVEIPISPQNTPQLKPTENKIEIEKISI